MRIGSIPHSSSVFTVVHLMLNHEALIDFHVSRRDIPFIELCIINK